MTGMMVADADEKPVLFAEYDSSWNWCAANLNAFDYSFTEKQTQQIATRSCGTPSFVDSLEQAVRKMANGYTACRLKADVVVPADILWHEPAESFVTVAKTAPLCSYDAELDVLSFRRGIGKDRDPVDGTLTILYDDSHEDPRRVTGVEFHGLHTASERIAFLYKKKGPIELYTVCVHASPPRWFLDALKRVEYDKAFAFLGFDLLPRDVLARIIAPR
ncbi:MAG: hypothetical protein WC802_03665 [Patescibacteria group bacterium]